MKRALIRLLDLLSDPEKGTNRAICILGAGEKIYGFHWSDSVVRVDRRKLPETDLVLDLEEKDWGIKDRFDLVIAEHIAEHMTDRIRFITQALGLLKPEGTLIIEVPSWKSECGHSTLEHKSTWGRACFDKNYITEYLGVECEKVQFRIAWWGHKLFYLQGFSGRMADRFRLASAYRFYLKRKQGGSASDWQ